MKAFRLALFFAPALVMPGLSAPAQTQITYPWCAVYSGGKGGGTNCGFSTLEQCRATVSGIGGFCERNTFYTGRTDTGPVRHPKTNRKRVRDY